MYRLDPKYQDAETMGYRDLSLNVEVGWVMHQGIVQFEPVKHWESKQCNTHICEIQGDA
jgi:hypothetical protein